MTNRLAGVDGLRAVAALWVVFFHVWVISGVRFPGIPALDFLLGSGSTGVSLFLVLSGFCLYAPFAAGRAGRFRPGEFFIRRFRRLLPAYYVSLVLALALNLATATWQGLVPLTQSEAIWQLLTHVTFTHTWFESSFYYLNGAYWSLGLEWQLYLGLPVLVWAIRRFGLPGTIGAVVLVNLGYRLALESAETQGWLDGSSMLATTVLPNQLPGRWAEFALGMVAAELHASGRLEAWTEHRHRILAAMLAMVPVALFASRLAVGHMVYGVLFTLLLMLVLTSGTRIAQVFASPPLVAIGTMSYSLYLVHQPLIQVLGHALALEVTNVSPTITFFGLVALLPVIFLVAWTLYWMVERHTLHATRTSAISGATRRVPKGSAPMPPSGRSIDQGVTLA